MRQFSKDKTPILQQNLTDSVKLMKSLETSQTEEAVCTDSNKKTQKSLDTATAELKMLGPDHHRNAIEE